MKKLLFIAIISVVALASCSKERKLNRKLDGTWMVTSYDGQAMGSGESITITFDKDEKDNGKYTMTSVYSGFTYTESGTYQLTKDDMITLTSGNDSDIMTVTDYSKTDMTVTSDGDIMILKKQ